MLALFILAQIMDGVFTLYGIGFKYETNPLLIEVYSLLGSAFWTIFWAKLFSIILGIFIYKYREKTMWARWGFLLILTLILYVDIVHIIGLLTIAAI